MKNFVFRLFPGYFYLYLRGPFRAIESGFISFCLCIIIVLLFALRCRVHCSATVSNAADGRHTRCSTAAVRAADGR
ncbi:MAG: hypothetical protein HXL36_07885 [Prevotellaceae bacterium]|nr:hypothetical protein [Prevotellaceae bacterium]